MKLLQLRIFRDIAYEQSFVKAAQLNHITQPAVSAQIKLLEEELGVKLFDRVPRKVALTPEGRTYLAQIEEILQKCDDLLIGPDGPITQAPKGEVRVASIPSIGMYELGSFLRSFMYQYPQIKINLQYQDANQVYELVKKKKVDLGMVAYSEKHTSLKSMIFTKDKLCLIVPAHHPLGTKSQVRLKEIEEFPFVAFDSNTPTRNSIDRLLKSKNIKVSIQITNNNIFALKKAVEAGLGVSIVPWKTVEDEVRNGTIRRIPIGKASLTRPLSIITLKDRSKSKVKEIFVSALLTHHTGVEV